MLEYLKKKLFGLEEEEFHQKIREIEEHLGDSPEGITAENLEAFKHIVRFFKELRGLKDLNVFLASNQGKGQVIC